MTKSILELVKAAEVEPGIKPPHYPALPFEGATAKDLPPATPEEQAERMAYFRKIVREWQFQPVFWYDRKGRKRQQMVDGFSASHVCQVYDALNEKSKADFCKLEPLNMIKIALKLAG